MFWCVFRGFPWKTKGGGLYSLGRIHRSNGFGLWSFWVNPFTRPSLRKIGEMACATPAWSSRGHALKRCPHERNFRKSDRAPKVPIFECKWCTKAQHHRILQKCPIQFRLLTKPSLSFFYMWHMIKYPYLNKWPFPTAFKTTTGECRDRW